MTETLNTLKPTPTRGRKIVGVFVIAVIVLLIIMVVAGIGSAISGSSGPAYKATVVGLTVIDPSDVTVLIKVTTTDAGSSKPTCVVNLSSSGGGYSGNDGFTADVAVSASSPRVFPFKMSVNKSGAQYVDIADSTVTCS
jgi:hypothetical protein